MTHAINWFEIAVSDMDRAAAFYDKLVGRKLQRTSFGGQAHAVFPYEGEQSVSGALVADKDRKPGAGTLIYLNANGALDAWLERVVPAGGKVLQPRTAIGEHGFIAIVADTEGNRIGLHSM